MQPAYFPGRIPKPRGARSGARCDSPRANFVQHFREGKVAFWESHLFNMLALVQARGMHPFSIPCISNYTSSQKSSEETRHVSEDSGPFPCFPARLESGEHD